MKRKIFCYALCTLSIILLCTGCEKPPSAILDPKNPTVITLWHSYNSHVKTVFDGLVLEFNETLGIEQGIIIDTYNYSDSKQLEDAVYASANQIIGSDPMPNVFTSYPNNAYRVDQLIPLVPLNQYFSKEEMSEYRAEFLQEGIWGNDSSAKMIPVAKSTEVLYLNKTDWEKFSQSTGLSIDLLGTWEGLLEASSKYYEWSGGKPMLGFNPFNDFMSLTAAQLNVQPYTVTDGKATFSYDLKQAKQIWDICYVPHLKGWYSSDSYSSDGIKSGNLIAYLGSSAGSGYFPTEVTRNSKEIYPIECIVLPYPTFTGKSLQMGQRGANMCIVTSDKAHEYATAQFLKWFTQPEQNTKFAISTGYLPVKNAALTSLRDALQHAKKGQNSDAIEKCITVNLNNINEYNFVSSKQFDGCYNSTAIFYNSIFDKIQEDLTTLNDRVKNGESRECVISQLTEDAAFQAWYNRLIVEASKSLH